MKISDSTDTLNTGKKHLSIPIRVPKYTTQHHHIISNNVKHTRPNDVDSLQHNDISENTQPYKFPHLQFKGIYIYIYISIYIYIYI